MAVIREKILGFEKYYIGTDGTVLNFDTKRILKQCTLRNGYKTVCLSNGKFKRVFYVHRLVALAFIPNKHNKPCIDHINNDKSDNSITNLRWCSYSENCYNRTRKCNARNKYKWVYPYGKDKFYVIITIDKQKINLGVFDNEKEAVMSANKKILELDIKNFVKLNIYSD
jgi:hypothetical protein